MASRRRMTHLVQLIRSMLSPAPAFAPEAEGPLRIQVERSTFYPIALIDPKGAIDDPRLEPVMAAAIESSLSSLVVVNRLGHRRPAYRGLLVYSWAQAVRLLGNPPSPGWRQSHEAALRVWGNDLERRLPTLDLLAGLPAARGAMISEAAWNGLALYMINAVTGAGPDRKVASLFDRLVAGQTREGAFLSAGPADNLESYWYDELALIHAIASYAMAARDPRAIEAVERATEYHVLETQPDHASNDPWALHAFARTDGARSYAEQLLHATRVQQPGGATGVASMLLADALYWMTE